MTEQEEIDRAQFVAGLLRDDRFLTVLEELRARAVAAWRTAEDLSTREAAWHRDQMIGDLLGELQRIAQRPAFTQAQRAALSS